MLTAMATMVITIPDLLMVTKVIYLIVSITLVFKLMSYSNVNRELRAAWLLRWRVAKVVGGAKTVSCPKTLLIKVEEGVLRVLLKETEIGTYLRRHV